MIDPQCEVAIVEDHTLLAESLAMAMRLRAFNVVVIEIGERGLASIQHDLLAAQPGAVLLDLDLGAGNRDGVTLVEPLTAVGIDVLVLTGSRDPVRFGECLAAGARAVLAKATPLDEIVRALREVTAGREVVEPSARSDLIRCWQAHRQADQQRRERFDRLTQREGEVLLDLVRGLRTSDIAAAAYVSKYTVRTQVKSILSKLEVGSQIEAVAEARRCGWGRDR